MAMNKSKINYAITATDQTGGTFAAIGQKLKQTNDSLKKSIGEESAFGALGKGLRGAGAVAGLHLLGVALERAATKAAELRQEFDEGRLSAAGLVEEIARGLPVIGSFVAAGRGIRELFTQENATAMKDLAAANQTAVKLQKTIDAEAALKATMAGRLAALGRERELAGAGDDFERQRIIARQALQDRLQPIDEARRGFLGDRGQRKAELDALEKQERELHAIRVKHIAELEAAAAAARQKALAEERSREAATFRRRVERYQAELREQASLRAEFAKQDVVAGLRERAGVLQTLISTIESRRPRMGATASSITDRGIGSVLAARENRSADPVVNVAKEQKRELSDINATLKRIEAEAKQRYREAALASPIF